MNVNEFVSIWKKHAESLYDGYTCGDGKTAVSKLLLSLNLDADGEKNVKKLIEFLLVDTHYTFLMGLDGSANIGGVQQHYKLYDENGQLVYEPGDIESEAYEQFQEDFLK
ncbi:MAG: hypothetical protein Q3M24_17190 [Candidatus Electrothrix aestuarii]|uniref:Uncharacterized protein n=1 Tax=Candidatus Electrothrix aestuarii TaxID=3062594 RepID=A0AAU8LT11_9BACT|nr:hypothetical protein [Candidatus Electrothrix aestuarii]